MMGAVYTFASLTFFVLSICFAIYGYKWYQFFKIYSHSTNNDIKKVSKDNKKEENHQGACERKENDTYLFLSFEIDDFCFLLFKFILRFHFTKDGEEWVLESL